jgi:hypothetical protein
MLKHPIRRNEPGELFPRYFDLLHFRTTSFVNLEAYNLRLTQPQVYDNLWKQRRCPGEIIVGYDPPRATIRGSASTRQNRREGSRRESIARDGAQEVSAPDH